MASSIQPGTSSARRPSRSTATTATSSAPPPTRRARHAPFLRAHLSVDQVDALLTHAVVRDHPQDAQASYPGNPDAGSTIFSIEAGGVKKQVSVFGLNPNPKAPNAAILKGLEDLATTLTDFESQVKAGKVESVDPYQPQMYRAILSEGAPDASIPGPGQT